MLILTRRVGETLMIGDQVSVTVLGVKGNQVRIGVNAPRNVSVHREEIYDRIQREHGGAARSTSCRSPIPAASLLLSAPFGEVAEQVEGAPLLREYGPKKSIEGSNPSLSASRHLSWSPPICKLATQLICCVSIKSGFDATAAHWRAAKIRRLTFSPHAS